MASPMPDSASSQFFIIAPDSPHLERSRAAFGYDRQYGRVDKLCEETRRCKDNNGSARRTSR